MPVMFNVKLVSLYVQYAMSNVSVLNHLYGCVFL